MLRLHDITYKLQLDYKKYLHHPLKRRMVYRVLKIMDGTLMERSHKTQ